MKMQLALILACALAAGPAAAQGSFSPGRKLGSGASPTQPNLGVPAPTETRATRARGYGAPEAPTPRGFEPYKPFKGGSVYSRPNKSGPSGAKPCETSVYTNACGR